MKGIFESEYDKYQPNRGFGGAVGSCSLCVLLRAVSTSASVELGNIQNAFDQHRFVTSSNRQALVKRMIEEFIADYKRMK